MNYTIFGASLSLSDLDVACGGLFLNAVTRPPPATTYPSAAMPPIGIGNEQAQPVLFDMGVDYKYPISAVAAPLASDDGYVRAGLFAAAVPALSSLLAESINSFPSTDGGPIEPFPVPGLDAPPPITSPTATPAPGDGVWTEPTWE